MSKICVLFPCSPLNGLHKVDEDFQQEMDAAIKAGFKTAFFDHDKLVRDGVVDIWGLPDDGRILLRGWMLSLEQYEKLFAACGALLTSPEEYESKHYWPKAYEKYSVLRKNSPKCHWTDTKDFSVKHIKQFFGGAPIVVKDHVKSAKGAKENAMFIKNSGNKQEVFTVISNMIAERGPLFQRGIVMKEKVELEKDDEGNSIEFRAFFCGGRVINVEPNGCNWSYLRAQFEDDSAITRLLETIAKELGEGFYTVDLMLSNGKWMVLECGDGQVSGLAPSCNPMLFYERLRSELKRNDPPEPEEEVLTDDYPVYWDYLYVADGKVVRSDIRGTVADLRRDLAKRGISAKEITTCDIATRAKLVEKD